MNPFFVKRKKKEKKKICDPVSFSSFFMPTPIGNGNSYKILFYLAIFTVYEISLATVNCCFVNASSNPRWTWVFVNPSWRPPQVRKRCVCVVTLVKDNGIVLLLNLICKFLYEFFRLSPLASAVFNVQNARQWLYKSSETCCTIRAYFTALGSARKFMLNEQGGVKFTQRHFVRHHMILLWFIYSFNCLLNA